MIYQHPHLRLDWYGDEGLIALCLDGQGAVNKFDRDTLSAFGHALAAARTTSGVRGLLIHSAKESFVVGADIGEFLGLFRLPAAELRHWLAEANALFNQLEDLPFPTLAAINGIALGGGCELVLACDFRLATAQLRLGLPEVKLGIMPGFGGSVRLPRLIGADNAIDWICSGRDHDAQAALKVGAIDGVIAADQLLSAASRTLLKASSGELDWPARRASKKAPLPLAGNELLMSQASSSALLAAQAGRHYPAPLAACQAIIKAASHERAGALAIEAEAFIPLAQSPQAEALVGVFLAEQQLKGQMKQAARRALVTQHAAVLGAGIMGGGIACQGALKGTQMVMKDIRQPALDLGLQEASRHLLGRVNKGRMSAADMAQVLGRITPSLHYYSLSNSQLVVEAVVERADIKRQVLAEVEAVVADDCIIATNTSTIPLATLAGALRRPERFCGMHFFNPVTQMPLVEVIRGAASSQATIDQVVAWAAALGKTAVVVKDCPGFFVNRVLFPYFAAFCQLLAEGVAVAHLEALMTHDFGWPMGPAQLLDVVGLDTARHAQQVMADAYPERMACAADNIIVKLVEQGWLGQKSGQGFYRWHSDANGKKQQQDAAELLTLLPQPLAEQPPAAILSARLLLPMINECVRCLEEGIIATPAEGDIALLFGLGFPAFRGGPFRYLDQLGLAAYLALANQLAACGPLYQPPALLQQMAAANRCFYPR